MISLILTTATKYLLQLLLLFSFFLLIRGHYEPGGGFVGGLVAASAFALYTISNGAMQARKMFPSRPNIMIISGLGIALAGGIIGLLAGDSFLTAVWLDMELPVIGSIGTPILFDLGVYLVVIGVILTIIFNLAAE